MRGKLHNNRLLSSWIDEYLFFASIYVCTDSVVLPRFGIFSQFFISFSRVSVFPLKSHHSVICMYDDDDARAGEGEERPVEGRNKARERVPRGENQSVTRREREGRGKRTG